MSIFYIFGVGLLLFFLWPQDIYSLSYANLYMTVDLEFWNPERSYFFFSGLKTICGFWLVTFVFKITLAPFSSWVVTVYSQIPVLFLLVLMTIYKFIYFTLFLKLFLSIVSLVPDLAITWSTLVLIFVIPSMFVGCLAYREVEIKALLAYTTISQMGYIMAGFLTFSEDALSISLVYLIFYCLQLSVVLIIFIILQAKYNFTHINQLYLVRKYNIWYCYMLVFIFFSFAGVPPLSGFFFKYFIFLKIYQAGFFIVSICGLVSGFLMSIIYLHVILQLLWEKTGQGETLFFEQTKQKIFFSENVIAYRRVYTCLEYYVFVVAFINIFFIFFYNEIDDYSDFFWTFFRE